MPNIKPISDLRNYTEVLKEVDVSNRVYLTRNGHGEYGILTMAEIDELDRFKQAYTLFSKLHKAEERAEKEGWIDADEMSSELYDKFAKINRIDQAIYESEQEISNGVGAIDAEVVFAELEKKHFG